ncbi:hypothetical protein ACIPEN_00575 [Herbaspirillum chlorophenolicum]|uniref:Glycosyltransferase family 1 protein n=1 Tax=Herbaspirillum chlorophenolicum TaxID=211589 RepID=A0ABW8EW46_9BURK
MRMDNGSFCVVASTLPVGFMARQFDMLRVKKIFVMSAELEKSYLRLREAKAADVEVVRVPEGLLAQSLFFLGMLLQARLGGTAVVFFHECCLPVFDLLLKLVRPRGYYLPQVTMSSWQEISFPEFPAGRLRSLLKWLGVSSRFRYYRSPPVGGQAGEHVMSIRSYPGSITTIAPGTLRQTRSPGCCCGGKADRILFITGKSSAPDDSLRAVYRMLIAQALARGYACDIKDHPNPVYRLELDAEGAQLLDPLLPAELLESDYHLAVGVSSSALLNYNDRAVSLINLLADMSPEDRAGYVRHFEGAMPGNGIRYVASADEFEALL